MSQFWSRLPEALLRMLLWILVHSLYRIRTEGRENAPAKGGALLVANHLSLVDALLLMSSMQRRVRFLDFQRHLRAAVGETIRPDGGSNPDILRRSSSRNDPLAARGQRLHSIRPRG